MILVDIGPLVAKALRLAAARQRGDVAGQRQHFDAVNQLVFEAEFEHGEDHR